jgi:hypothetical protein
MAGLGVKPEAVELERSFRSAPTPDVGGAVVTRVIHSPRALGAAAGLPKSDFDRILAADLSFLTSDDPTLIFWTAQAVGPVRLTPHSPTAVTSLALPLGAKHVLPIPFAGTTPDRL